MNTLGWTLCAAPAFALALVPLTTQQVETPQSGVQTRTPLARADSADQNSWRERLSNKDLVARENDFENLVSRAAQSDETRATLEAWSKDEEHLEFAWTCRLALREAKSRAAHVDPFGAMGGGDPFEAMRQRMFGGQGADPFSGFMTIDPFGRGSQLTIDPFSSLQNGSGSNSEAERFSMEITPDGVKAHVKKNVNGQDTDEEYSAKSVEDLLAAHPELSGRIGNGRTGFQIGLPGFSLDARPRVGLRTDRLGVYVPAEVEQGSTGLRIQSVVPGTLAAELGLEAGQELVTINGRAIQSRDDISSALRERSADATVDIEVRDADGNLSTKTWKPSTPSRGAGRPLEPRPLDGV